MKKGTRTAHHLGVLQSDLLAEAGTARAGRMDSLLAVLEVVEEAHGRKDLH